MAAGGLLEAVEELDGRALEEVGGVNAALGVGEEGAFEVDAEGLAFVGGGGASMAVARRSRAARVGSTAAVAVVGR